MADRVLRVRIIQKKKPQTFNLFELKVHVSIHVTKYNKIF